MAKRGAARSGTSKAKRPDEVLDKTKKVRETLNAGQASEILESSPRRDPEPADQPTTTGGFPTTLSDFIDLANLAGNLPELSNEDLRWVALPPGGIRVKVPHTEPGEWKHLEPLINEIGSHCFPVLRALKLMVDQLKGSRFEGLCRPPYSLVEVYVFASLLGPLFRALAVLQPDRVDNRGPRPSDSGTPKDVSDQIPRQQILPFNFPLFWEIKADSTGRFRVSPPPTSTCHYLVQTLKTALEGKKASLIRTCLKDGCDRLFFAGRKDQLCCSTRHNDARWQREYYAKHGKKGDYKLVDEAQARKSRARLKGTDEKQNEKPATASLAATRTLKPSRRSKS